MGYMLHALVYDTIYINNFVIILSTKLLYAKACKSVTRGLKIYRIDGVTINGKHFKAQSQHLDYKSYVRYAYSRFSLFSYSPNRLNSFLGNFNNAEKIKKKLVDWQKVSIFLQGYLYQQVTWMMTATIFSISILFCTNRLLDI